MTIHDVFHLAFGNLYGVDIHLFRKYEKEELERVKAKYNLPERFILFVGNVKLYKNLKGVLGAFKIVSKRINDLFLVIVKKRGFY